ncbi:MAG: hypothetical protein ACJ74U_10450 [Jatrophihabitantaceae bacterium]
MAVLATCARRGRRTEQLALILFAHRLPVAEHLLTAAIKTELQKFHANINALTARATTRFPPPTDPELRQSDGFERAEALARLTTADGTAMPSTMRRNLRSARRPTTPANVVSIMTLLFAGLFDAPETLALGDDQTAEDVLHTFGAHGLIEPVGPDGPTLVSDGASAVTKAINAVAGLAFQPLPEDATLDELAITRDFCADLGPALAAMPVPQLRHNLGGDIVLNFWDPTDPSMIAVLLSSFLLIRRTVLPELDNSEIVEAVRGQGWLDSAAGSDTRPSSLP